MTNLVTFIQPLVGLAGLMALAWAFSEDRSRFPLRWAFAACAIQLILAVLFLRVPFLQKLLASAGAGVAALERAARAGSSFMFGHLGGAPLPYETVDGANSLIIAFQILPIIMVTAALAALLWHWRILPILIKGLSFTLEKTLNIGGAASLGTAANFFLGVVESPLIIRAYLNAMTRSEIFIVMVAGLATVSGAVLVLYASILEGVIHDATGHILTASLISLPAALLFGRIMVPDENMTQSNRDTRFEASIQYDSTLDALVRGVEDGLKVFLSVMAMLIVVIALVHLTNEALGLLPNVGGNPLSVARIFGWFFAPIVMMFGIPFEEALTAGQLMGTKSILNEFLAYQQLSSLPEGTLSARSTIIMTYALCGFANLGSIGLQLATFSTLVPQRRSEITAMAWRAWFAGNLATGATASIAALVI